MHINKPDRQTDKETERQTDRQRDRQIKRHTYIQTDSQTDRDRRQGKRNTENKKICNMAQTAKRQRNIQHPMSQPKEDKSYGEIM